MKKILVWMLLTVLLLGTALPGMAEINTYTKCGTHGTAKRLNGRTVIVSIFADDSRWVWDFGGNDVYTYSNVYNRLGIAVRWIMNQAAAYGAHCEMIWDWLDPNNYDLYHRFTFTRAMLNGESSYRSDFPHFIDCIDRHVNSDEIMRKHNAENILYLFFFNSPKPEGLLAYANPYGGELAFNVCGYEFAVFSCGYNFTPGPYAHEILHLFGVPDLYLENRSAGITKKFMSDYARRYPRDIMAGGTSSNFNEVNYTFSPLVAYYAGLTSKSEDQRKWNLQQSEYVLYGF